MHWTSFSPCAAVIVSWNCCRPDIFYPNVIRLRSGLCYGKSICCFKSFVVCLSSITFVRPTHGVETFGNISLSFCTLAILWPPCKILWRSSEVNCSFGGVKRKRGSKIERCHVRVSHLLMNFFFIIQSIHNRRQRERRELETARSHKNTAS